MKIHRLLVEQVAAALRDIFFENRHAEKVVEYYLGHNRKWGSRDRRFFAESVYECVRWWRKIWFLLNEDPNPDNLRKVWLTWWILQGNLRPDWSEFADFSEAEIKKRNAFLEQQNDDRHLAIRESVPDWLYAWGKSEHGEEWPKILSALNQKAPVDLRVNTLLIERENLQKKLREEGIETEVIPDVETGLTLVERKNVFTTDCYKKGYFEVQDRSSQKIAPFLSPLPKDRVIDACAGAGGKTLHLAALMKNKGKIIAMDIHEWKLKELKARAARDKVDIIEAKLIDSTKVVKRAEASADRVLIDVPCTGMGVLRRHSDTKWKLSLEEVQKLRDLQQSILNDYSRMVRNGGFLVYATCSLMKSENQDQVAKFLQNQGSSWELVNELKLLPQQNSGDGFYAALLQRKA